MIWKGCDQKRFPFDTKVCLAKYRMYLVLESGASNAAHVRNGELCLLFFTWTQKLCEAINVSQPDQAV